MEQFLTARIKSACVDTAFFVAFLAVVLGCVGALIVQSSPELEAYWHGGSLLTIAFVAILRSTTLLARAWREIEKAEQA